MPVLTPNLHANPHANFMTSPHLRGGLMLEAHKQRSTMTSLRRASAPGEVILPLNQHAGAAALALVAVGDQVLLGQPVAQPGADISAWLHSPVSGQVIAIEPRAVASELNTQALSIVIANDGTDSRHGANLPVDFTSLQPVELCEHIARGGIVGLGGATFPTAEKLLHALHSPPVHLILNGAECEPWISCDDMLMRERAADVVMGARILRHALNATRCTIAIESDMPEAQRALETALATTLADNHASNHKINLSVIPSLYPAGGERQLITAITGTEVPQDGLPSDIGVVCHNVGTAAAVSRWICEGEPLLSRIVTITGSGVRAPGNLEVRLGTALSSVIADCGGYVDEVTTLIMGGSMTGMALTRDDLPVVKGTNCIVAATAADLRPRAAEMPCIRCGNCAQVCPAILLPQQLHWHALAHDLPALDSLGLRDCIECGCCDYVCPSQIPLTQQFRAAKTQLLEMTTAHDQAVAARARYEAREQRLARLEREQRTRLEEKRRAFKAGSP